LREKRGPNYIPGPDYTPDCRKMLGPIIDSDYLTPGDEDSAQAVIVIHAAEIDTENEFEEHGRDPSVEVCPFPDPKPLWLPDIPRWACGGWRKTP
jgi:hypothetical protein